MSKRPYVLAGLALSALLVAGAFLRPHRAPGASATGAVPQVDEEVRALLDGLSPGDRIAGYRVHALPAAEDGVASVELTMEDAVYFSVLVSRRGRPGPRPPIETDRYAVGYGKLWGKGDVPEEMMLRAASEIAARIRRREATAGVPRGL